MKKALLTLTLYSGLVLAQNNNETNITGLKDLNVIYTIPLDDDSDLNTPLSTDSENVQIRLLPLTTEQKTKAEQIGKNNEKLEINLAKKIKGKAFLPDKQITDYTNFYGYIQPVLDQKTFGSCVTFATTAGLGYVSNKNTGLISTTSVLFQGHINAKGDPETSGWDGLQTPLQVLSRIIDNQEGYYKNSYNMESIYAELSKNFSKANLDGSEYAKMPMFNSELKKYINFTATNTPTQINNINYRNLELNAGDANNAETVRNSLASGHKVLIGFAIYDAKQPNTQNCTKKATVTGDSTFSYDKNEKLLKLKTGKAKTSNTWTRASGCLLGGHEVLVVSDFKDRNGNVMFLIRNSWGKTGDQGNYYMSADYLNDAALNGVELSQI